MTRRADLSFEEFSHYWVNKHRPLVQTIWPIMENAFRYAQQHSINAVPEGVPAAPYDGVAELWFESQENFFFSSSWPAASPSRASTTISRCSSQASLEVVPVAHHTGGRSHEPSFRLPRIHRDTVC
ncbi:EthD domain-containing protein [Rhizobium ruizarguesonis]|uniref:EthD domain-containing protein n=1 Tax=Rhizobium ruizarguesonis TaxID=2081791 RepID=UPI0010305A41|nr:EthD domain-containing protein [Rhizobium ruizarguesonis]TBC98790.1 EthD family reductase [Rhizobium ruizarguesonis]TBD15625.1 EthD family reductase [Rhizobium ruizarguesonis]TBE96656.1 EthD family reductase [Rhizobium ruizarguesonis]